MLGKAFEIELQHFFKGMSLMSWVGHFLALAVFGLLVPLRQGLDFLDVMFLLAYACLPCLFAAPLVAESVASRRIPPPREGYLAQVLTPTLFALLWLVLILATGFITVNAASRIPRVVLPPLPVLLNVVALSIALTLLAGALTAWLSLNIGTVKLAKAHSRRLFLLMLVLVLLWTRMAPPAWRNFVTDRLTAGRITWFIGPLSLLFLALGLALLRAGTRRREEDEEGPLLKLV